MFEPQHVTYSRASSCHLATQRSFYFHPCIEPAFLDLSRITVLQETATRACIWESWMSRMHFQRPIFRWGPYEKLVHRGIPREENSQRRCLRLVSCQPLKQKTSPSCPARRTSYPVRVRSSPTAAHNAGWVLAGSVREHITLLWVAHGSSATTGYYHSGRRHEHDFGAHCNAISVDFPTGHKPPQQIGTWFSPSFVFRVRKLTGRTFSPSLSSVLCFSWSSNSLLM